MNHKESVVLAQSSEKKEGVIQPSGPEAPNGTLALAALSCIFPFWSGNFNVACMGGPLIKYGFGFAVGKTVLSSAFTVASLALFDVIPRSHTIGSAVGLILTLGGTGLLWTALTITDMIFSVKKMRYHYPALKRAANAGVPGRVEFSLFPRVQQKELIFPRAALVCDGMDIRATINL